MDSSEDLLQKMFETTMDDFDEARWWHDKRTNHFSSHLINNVKYPGFKDPNLKNQNAELLTHRLNTNRNLNIIDRMDNNMEYTETDGNDTLYNFNSLSPDKVNIADIEFNYYQELDKYLVPTCDLLGITREECFISTPYDMGVPTLKYRDKIVATQGLDTIPYIRHIGNRNIEVYSFCPGQGITIFETDNGLRYAVLFYGTITGSSRVYFISNKRDIKQLRRHFLQVAVDASREDEVLEPIMDPQIIQTVMDNSINFLLNKRKIGSYGVRVRRGIILAGPAGNGKTSLCRWIQYKAREHRFTSQIFDGTKIDRIAGEGQMQNAFRTSGKGGIIFIDDIEMSHLNRSAGKGSTASSLLSAMDGIASNEDMIFIMTTNEKLNGVEDAFVRPGRIDVVLDIPMPTLELRKRFIDSRWHADIREYLEKDNNMEKLLDFSKEMSFAQMDNIKATLVANKVFYSEWDIDKTIKDIIEGREAVEHQVGNTKRKTGFK